MDTHLDRRLAIRDSKELGWVLSEIRHVRGNTQQEVSNGVGMDRTQLAHLEAGRHGRYLTNLLAVLHQLGATLVIEWSVPVQDQEGGTDSPQPRAGLPSASARLTEVERQTKAMQRALAPITAKIEELRTARDQGASTDR
jgi:transcriptional regulator with XRE-family HTH domain